MNSLRARIIKNELTVISLYAGASAATRLGLILLSGFGLVFLSSNQLEMLGVLISFAPLFTYLFDCAISKVTVRFWFFWHATLNSYLHQIVKLRYLYYLIILPFVVVTSLYLANNFFPQNSHLKTSVIALLLFGMAESCSLLMASFCRLENSPLFLFKLKFSIMLVSLGFAVSCFFVDLMDYVFFAYALTHFLATNVVFIVYYLRPKVDDIDTLKLPKKDILRFSFPLTIHDISWWLKGFAMAIIVSKVADPVVASGYFIAITLASPLYLLVSGFDQAYAADYYKARNESAYKNLNRVRNKYRILSLIMLFALIGSVFVREIGHFTNLSDILTITSDVLPIIFLGPVFQSLYVVWVKPHMYNKSTQFIGISSFSISVIALYLCYDLFIVGGYLLAGLLSSMAFLLISLTMLAVSIFRQLIIVDVWVPLIVSALSILSLFVIYFVSVYAGLALLFVGSMYMVRLCRKDDIEE
ncbi:MAG: hypothetical protein P8O79_14320 [Halieaceae bacterium]|nr:hypothetical protein [Halieaceae bacterium]